MNQSGAAGSDSKGFPVIVNTYLSKDKTFGNSDDVLLVGTVFLVDAKGKTQSHTETGTMPDSIKAGGYYVVTQVDQAGLINESNEHNNVSFSRNQDVRIVTDKFSGDVNGSSKNDSVVIRGNSDNTIVTINGKSSYFDTSDHAPTLNVKLGKGNDTLKTDGEFGLQVRLIADGGAGNDTLYGGAFDDSIAGGSGKDKIFGGTGNDTLLGGAGNDYLQGDAGIDRVDGGSGTDSGKKDSSDSLFTAIEKTI